MQLTNLPFKRVAVDLMGPVTPASDKEEPNVLTLVHYATLYPEAIPLKNSDAKIVADQEFDYYLLLLITQSAMV